MWELVLEQLERERKRVSGKSWDIEWYGRDFQSVKANGSHALRALGQEDNADRFQREFDKLFSGSAKQIRTIERLDFLRDRIRMYMAEAEFPPSGQQSKLDALRSSRAQKSDRVFVVHGHNHELRDNIISLLRRHDFQPVVLTEQAGSAKTVIELIEEYSDVSYAICLLTGDDIGGKTKAELRPRARQNVILEIGYFFALLSRDRLSVVLDQNVEPPSDLTGLRPIINKGLDSVLEGLERDLRHARMIV